MAGVARRRGMALPRHLRSDPRNARVRRHVRPPPDRLRTAQTDWARPVRRVPADARRADRGRVRVVVHVATALPPPAVGTDLPARHRRRLRQQCLR